MPLVPKPAERSGADADIVVLAWRRDQQMIRGEAQRDLCFVIALDHDVAAIPNLLPALAMLLVERIVTFCRHVFQGNRR